MKNIFYLMAFVFSSLVFMGCGEDFLSRDNLYGKNEESFYATEKDIDEALNAVYAAMASINSGSGHPLVWSELMSDDRLGGGDYTDYKGRAWDQLSLDEEDQYDDLWNKRYVGIYRANMLIQKFDNAEFSNEDLKNQVWGEVHFLRAYFYFTLAKFYGDVPLITNPADYDVPKSPAEDVYTLIADDLKIAIENLPNKNFDTFLEGKLTKWAAEGYMARVFLFYTGKYEKTELPSSDGAVTKAQVIDWVVDCIDNSGHDLVPDFRELWPYTYANDSATNYRYVIDNDLEWVGDTYDNNPENMFMVKYSPYGEWGNTFDSYWVVAMGPRMWTTDDTSADGEGHIMMGGAWGFGPVNPQMWDGWDDNDIRKEGSILSVTNPNEGANYVDGYVWGANGQNNETGFWQKKYTPIQTKVLQEDNSYKNIWMWEQSFPSNSSDKWRRCMQDYVVLRFADVLLMAAELGAPQAQSYLDRVRERVGLPSISVNLENIKLERRYELAFEGLRYHDLLRWHDAEAALDAVVNIAVKTGGESTTYNFSTGRIAETDGFIAIPPAQVRLSNGTLTQNKGW